MDWQTTLKDSCSAFSNVLTFSAFASMRSDEYCKRYDEDTDQPRKPSCRHINFWILNVYKKLYFFKLVLFLLKWHSSK